MRAGLTIPMLTMMILIIMTVVRNQTRRKLKFVDLLQRSPDGVEHKLLIIESCVSYKRVVVSDDTQLSFFALLHDASYIIFDSHSRRGRIATPTSRHPAACSLENSFQAVQERRYRRHFIAG